MRRTIATLAATLTLVLVATAAFAAGARFTDVPASHPHADGIGWASDTGVVQGYPDGTFRPDQPITRGQLASILHRYDSQQAETPAATADSADGHEDFAAWYRCWEGRVDIEGLTTTEEIDERVAETLPADCFDD